VSFSIKTLSWAIDAGPYNQPRPMIPANRPLAPAARSSMLANLVTGRPSQPGAETMRIAVLLVGFLASAVFDTAAVAKDTAPPEITATGIKEFDDVFMQGQGHPDQPDHVEDEAPDGERRRQQLARAREGHAVQGRHGRPQQEGRRQGEGRR
jgi:hypothetical protein